MVDASPLSLRFERFNNTLHIDNNHNKNTLKSVNSYLEGYYCY